MAGVPDTVAGITCNMRLINEYLESKEQMDDPLAGTGADFVIFDGERSMEVITEALSVKKLPSETQVHHFAKSRERMLRRTL